MSVVWATSLLYCHYTTLWNAEVVVWPFITMNSYWIVHASTQKWLTENRQTLLTTIVFQRVAVSHHILVITACAQNVLLQSTNASGKRWHHSQTAGLTTCISQGSVVTVLKWGGKKYSHLRRVSSWCRTPKIIKISQCCTELFKKLLRVYIDRLMLVVICGSFETSFSS